jgi:hypothetical protein
MALIDSEPRLFPSLSLPAADPRNQSPSWRTGVGDAVRVGNGRDRISGISNGWGPSVRLCGPSEADVSDAKRLAGTIRRGNTKTDFIREVIGSRSIKPPKRFTGRLK